MDNNNILKDSELEQVTGGDNSPTIYSNMTYPGLPGTQYAGKYAKVLGFITPYVYCDIGEKNYNGEFEKYESYSTIIKSSFPSLFDLTRGIENAVWVDGPFMMLRGDIRR